jgi:hypothetical protein
MVPHLLARKVADVVFGQAVFMVREKDSRPAPWRKIQGHPWRWQEYRWANTIPHQSAFTNRCYFDRVGGFNEALRESLDYEHFLRGGKNLKAHYVPIAISGMREGGVTGSPLNLWRGFRMVQLAKKVLPPELAWLHFFYKIGRHYCGQVLHKLLDPIATKVAWSGRNTGNSL